MSDEWYYTSRGRQIGPISLLQLAEDLHDLANWREEYVWRSGFDNWVRAGAVEELQIIPSQHRRPTPPPLQSEKVRNNGKWLAMIFAVLIIAAGAIFFFR